MKFSDYEKKVNERAFYPGRGTPTGLAYTALGLGGEAGEAQEQIKKMLRDDGGVLTPERREKFLKELGDVLWYLTSAAHEAGSSLEEVAQMNNDKLDKRNRKTGKSTKG